MKILSNILMLLGWTWFLPKIILYSLIKTGNCIPKEDLYTGFFGICDLTSMAVLLQLIFNMLGFGLLAIFLLIIGIILGWINLVKRKIYLNFSSVLLYISTIFVIFVIINNFILH